MNKRVKIASWMRETPRARGTSTPGPQRILFS